MLKLTAMDGNQATLTTAPGRRDLVPFASDARRRESLEAMLTSVVGRPTKVTIVAPDTAGEDTASGPASSRGRQDLRNAYTSPLVKELMRQFDVTIVNVERDYDDAAPKESDDETSGDDNDSGDGVNPGDDETDDETDGDMPEEDRDR